MIEVVFLGTGSATPSLVRHHPAMALRKQGRIFLFDCGESTQHQLIRAKWSLNKIEYIFISHLHGDHIYGLPGLLSTMSLNNREKPLTLYGPPGIEKFISATQPHKEFNLAFLSIVECPPGRRVIELPHTMVIMAPLKHSILSFGFRIQDEDKPGFFDIAQAKRLGIPPGPLYGKLQKGQSIVHQGNVITPDMVLWPTRTGLSVTFLGDTIPCRNSLALAKKTDLLVHEGTYLETDNDIAARYLHSTFRNAAETARRAEADKLVITHIGAKYNAKELEGEWRSMLQIFPNTILARDLLKLTLAYKDREQAEPAKTTAGR